MLHVSNNRGNGNIKLGRMAPSKFCNKAVPLSQTDAQYPAWGNLRPHLEILPSCYNIQCTLHLRGDVGLHNFAYIILLFTIGLCRFRMYSVAFHTDMHCTSSGFDKAFAYLTQLRPWSPMRLEISPRKQNFAILEYRTYF